MAYGGKSEKPQNELSVFWVQLGMWWSALSVLVVLLPLRPFLLVVNWIELGYRRVHGVFPLVVFMDYRRRPEACWNWGSRSVSQDEAGVEEKRR